MVVCSSIDAYRSTSKICSAKKVVPSGIDSSENSYKTCSTDMANSSTALFHTAYPQARMVSEDHGGQHNSHSNC